MNAHLGLGTVQFGLDYGIANRKGRPNRSEISKILEVGRDAGMALLDTAIAYGEAETALGEIGISDWKVVSKLPSVPGDWRNLSDWMLKQVEESLGRLRIDRLHGLLLHRPSQLHSASATGIVEALESVESTGLAERVGVSIQTPEHDLPVVLRHLQPGIIQSPFNILQDDLVRHGWAEKLRGTDCEVHARSAFLQGLLLMTPEQRSEAFSRWKRYWEEWDSWLDRSKLCPVEACLRFVRSAPDIDYCIVGVDNADQLRELLEVGSHPLESLPDWPAPADQDLINPSRWPTQ